MGSDSGMLFVVAVTICNMRPRPRTQLPMPPPFLAELRPLAIPLWLLLNVRKGQRHFFILGLLLRHAGLFEMGLSFLVLVSTSSVASALVGRGGGRGEGAVIGGREGLPKVAKSYQSNAEN